MSRNALIDALHELARCDPRAGRIAAWRLLGSWPDAGSGDVLRAPTNVEIAALLGLPLRAIERDWTFAKAFLWLRLQGRLGRRG